MSSFSETGHVRTVLGDISPLELGHTQCHEHIFLEKGPSFESNAALCMNDMERSLLELTDFHAAGGKTIVDAQPVFCGRNAKALSELSRMSEINIVAVTGFHKKMFMEQNAPYSEAKDELIADIFTKEITEGMLLYDGTRGTAKAGIVKAAFEPGGLGDVFYGKLFASAAETARETGAPVLIHTEKETDIFELIRFFESAGISPDRLLICHLDRTRYDLGYHREILSTGCRLCYDSVNRLKYVSESEELELIRAMRDSGFIRQIVLSLDTTNQRLRSYYAKDMGLNYILKTYIPFLKNNGFSEEEISLMCAVNARDALSFKQGE